MKNIGLIGCGNIAETYFRAQEYFNNINFVACAVSSPRTGARGAACDFVRKSVPPCTQRRDV